MTDEMKTFQKALGDAAKDAPPKDAKAKAVAVAMAAFDEKFEPRAQESAAAGRLRGWASALHDTILGRQSMTINQALSGGASIAVLALGIATATYVQRDISRFGNDLDAPSPPAADAKSMMETLRDAETEQVGRNAGAPDPATEPNATIAHDMAAPPPREEMAKARQPYGVPQANIGAHAPSVAMGEVDNFASGGAAKSAPVARNYGIGMLRSMPDQAQSQIYRDQGRDKFERFDENPVKLVAEAPVSTFSIDVDTASYSFVRAALNAGHLPQKATVRVEELINYFPYDYARPKSRSVPFEPSISLMPAPWNAAKQLLHIGIAGYELAPAQKPKSNLVFLIDSSGSMNAPNKLPLVKSAMKLLLETLDEKDTVAIVTYAGGAGTLLEPTSAKQKAKIMSALDGLGAGGSTAGAEGIRQAYQLAEQGFEKDAVNRVILSTDGDFNVGITDPGELKSFVERKREAGIFLSVLGFGMGNYNDALMQTLAQNGNGTAAYIDTLNEARKVLVEEAGSTLFTIAKDVKIQVEFNPDRIAEYRLIGYETRALKRQDFNNDKVDAGDIGAGHRVTAIYELSPKGGTDRAVDDLRYQSAPKPSSAAGGEIAFLKIRYKLPQEAASKLITQPVTGAQASPTVKAAAREARFASSVAAFGQILKGGRNTGAFSYDDVIALAQGAKGDDAFGYRAEFITLVRLAKSAAALEPLASPAPAQPRR